MKVLQKKPILHFCRKSPLWTTLSILNNLINCPITHIAFLYILHDRKTQYIYIFTVTKLLEDLLNERLCKKDLMIFLVSKLLYETIQIKILYISDIEYSFLSMQGRDFELPLLAHYTSILSRISMIGNIYGPPYSYSLWYIYGKLCYIFSI